MTDDDFDRFVKRVGPQYREPPPTPTEAIWARIQATRTPEAGRSASLVVLADRRRRTARWVTGILAAAAVLLVGVAIGRFGVSGPTHAPNAVAAADSLSRPESTAFRLATVATLSQVKTLLADYDADRITDDFHDSARELLSAARSLLASPRLADPATRQLLEDLELVLMQVARLHRSGQGDERGFIDDGMAERAIRHRLGSAIPAGPTA